MTSSGGIRFTKKDQIKGLKTKDVVGLSPFCSSLGPFSGSAAATKGRGGRSDGGRVVDGVVCVREAQCSQDSFAHTKDFKDGKCRLPSM